MDHDTVQYRFRANWIADITYGEHERQRFDVWLADSTMPTPLVIFYHGGGFAGGDKSAILRPEQFVRLKRFLQAGVSVASINYRYHNETEDEYGILGSLNDCRKALQFIRFHSNALNIQKDRIGAYGVSAGAGTALWIAFHKDMTSVTNNEEPYLRESTKLKVAGAIATQASYDISQWPQILAIQSVPPALKRKILRYALEIYDLDEVSQLHTPKFSEVRDKLHFLAHITRKDPPFWVQNTMHGGIPGTVQGISDECQDIVHKN